VATDRRNVRIFTIAGIQLQLFSIAGPVVSMAAFDNKLMIVYHSAIGLCLRYIVFKNCKKLPDGSVV